MCNILAFKGLYMSLLNKLTGMCSEYSRVARIVLPAISIGTGCVRGINWTFPQKLIVFIDELERGSVEPIFPMHE